MGMADCTRVGVPRFSSAVCMASAFITVASMPMWSAWARSMPLAAAETPRKMLPPPMTRHTSMPARTTSPTSLAMRPTISVSRPYSRRPIRASPEIFSRTRLGAEGMRGTYEGEAKEGRPSFLQKRSEKTYAPCRRVLTHPPSGSDGFLAPFAGSLRYFTPATAATSAAKSPAGAFSTPSPSVNRSKPTSVPPAFLTTARTRLSPSCTHTCSSSTTSS